MKTMNIKLSITAILLFLTSFCIAQDKFEIIGKLPKAGNGQTILLSYINSEGKSVKDSTKIANGKFALNGQTRFGNAAYLELKSFETAVTRTRSDYQEFFLEKGLTTLTGIDSIGTAIITGTKVQQDYIDYNTQMNPLQAQYKQIVARYYKAKAAKDSVELKQIAVDAKPLMAKMESTLDQFILSHPDSYFTATLIIGNKMAVIDVEKFDPIYKALSKNVLASFSGQKITEKYNKAKQFAVGKTIDFTLPDAKGNAFTLSSLKGKYVLVDFWASWCVPCRAENPFLLKAYKELKEKNFEIVGVSLDDVRQNWLNAVKVDNLPWTQVSDVKGFKTEVAVRFGITAIPQNVLLDPQGRVIAKDLRGEDVNKKIASYIK
jgi:thiol-disulfide isomerase/thioredoxin